MGGVQSAKRKCEEEDHPERPIEAFEARAGYAEDESAAGDRRERVTCGETANGRGHLLRVRGGLGSACTAGRNGEARASA